MILVGKILFGVGIAFLVLALLAAAKDILSSPKPSPADLREAFDPAKIAELVKELGKLKTWLALAIFGVLMTVLGASLMSGMTPQQLIAPAAEKASK